jgi:hypothetical protein
MMRGVCPECASPVRGSLSVCTDHDAAPDRLCGDCATPFVAWGELRCDTCRFAKRLPVELCVLGLAPVIGFLYTQDVDVLGLSLVGLFDLVRTGARTTVDETSHRAVTTVGTDAVVTVTLDEHLSVVDLTR